ncbi:MAG: bifunctional phosphoribosylaminoimidazolecarboxamide formyltransferase/IMP cyclohydrolase [Bacteriovoracaceae bacterium]
MMTENKKFALLSVTDKTGLEKVAKTLSEAGVGLLSSGGTKKYLESFGLDVQAVEKVTGNPEAFDGRMKTLSFQICSGILFRRSKQKDCEQIRELEIPEISYVVVNLYDFKGTLERTSDLSELIESVDVGGPTMLRAAAKNFHDVTVLSCPSQYDQFIAEFQKNKSTSIEFRKNLAAKVFSTLSNYDQMIATTLCSEMALEETYSEKRELRYGENPHQKGFVLHNNQGLAGVTPIQGKPLSYNNLLDCDAALRSCYALSEFGEFCATVVKHGNPCGQAISERPLEALELAWNGDPVSSFGSIIALNWKVSQLEAEFLTSRFIEVIIAKDFSLEALEILQTKKNLRVIQLDGSSLSKNEMVSRRINGGMVIQDCDHVLENEFKLVTKNEQIKGEDQLIRFGISATKYLKSNAISLVQKTDCGFQLIGAGMGNPNRLISIEQAAEKAKHNGITDFSNLVLISDAFFPFDDGVRLAAEYGIKMVVQPGGSIKDDKVIEAADELGLSMVLTGTRHFNH